MKEEEDDGLKFTNPDPTLSYQEDEETIRAKEFKANNEYTKE